MLDPSLKDFNFLSEILQTLLNVEFLNVQFELNRGLCLIKHVDRFELFGEHFLRVFCLELITTASPEHILVGVKALLLMRLEFLLCDIKLRFQVLLEKLGESAHENEFVFPELH